MALLRQLTSALVTALVALLCAMPGASAQEFPSRIARIVVAFPAGGPTDFVARLLADKLKSMLGQSFVVENKPAANGAVPAPMSSSEFGAFLRDELARWGRVVRERNIKGD